MERSHLIGYGEGLRQFSYSASVHWHRRVHHDAYSHVAVGGSFSIKSPRLCLWRLLHGRIGVATSLFVVAYLEPLLGWRGCFYALGGLGLALAAIMFFMKETPRKHETEAGKKEAEKEDQSGEALTEIRAAISERDVGHLGQAFKSSPALLMTVLGGVAFHFVLGAATFEQLWFVQERGFDRSEIAELSGWLAFAGGIF